MGQRLCNAEGGWKNGKTHGVQKEYYENGQLKAEVYFENDVIKKDVVYDKNGKIVTDEKVIQETLDIFK